MAIGMALLIGIRLPLNFASPYKAVSVIDFWRRWHMTLSAFLRDYLYIPLGGNQRGAVRRYLNLALTMLIGGLWHGASWTFVAWGGLHGLYLLINQGWRSWRGRSGRPYARAPLGSWPARVMTFTVVVVAWVVFRAESFEAAALILRAMTAADGVVLPSRLEALFGPGASALQSLGVSFGVLGRFYGVEQLAWVAVAWLICWALPNTQELMGLDGQTLEDEGRATSPRGRHRLEWAATPAWAAATVVVLTTAILMLNRAGVFIYFQF